MTASWRYWNPVDIRFGDEAVGAVSREVDGSRYALVTYGEPFFRDLAERLAAAAGVAAIVIDDVLPNPDCRHLDAQAQRLWAGSEPVDVILAIGGGSVIDTAKVLAAARDGFDAVMAFVRGDAGCKDLSALPVIAVPTTAGTGSEVTCWATIWDVVAGEKHSLAHPGLYPRVAIIDPVLMVGKSRDLTRATGLDALSHALESIWNRNANPVSCRHAVFAARTILHDLPKLLDAPDDVALRTSLAEAALGAGLAFSNTKTAIAHNLSYPVTLRHGLAHGIACSFTLPTILGTVTSLGGFREDSLQAIFGPDLAGGSDRLAECLRGMGVALRFEDYGVGAADAVDIIDAAFLGQRGRNFIGQKEAFLAAAMGDGLI